MPSWLVTSLLLSLVLTIVANAALRLLPRRPSRPTRLARPAPPAGRGVRVIVPWKAMLIASVLGTIVLNVLLRLG